MFRPFISILCIILLSVLYYGCTAGSSPDPVIPSEELQTATDSEGGIIALGSWQVVINPETCTAEIVSLRTCDLILNVLQFLEPPVLTGLTIANLVVDQPGKTVDVDVTIHHSLPSTKLKVFDTRGVVYGPEVVNTDGLTYLTSPEFFKDVPFGYIDGLLGTKDDVADYEGIMGFKYFADGLGTNDDLLTFMSDPLNAANRGVFNEGPNSATRHYSLDWSAAAGQFLVFNYSIYANWAVPAGDPPYELADYPIATANCQEAICVTVTETENTLWYSGGVGGGNLSLQMEIWDWQGNIFSATVLGTGVPLTEGVSAGAGTTDYSHLFDFTDIPVTPQAVGDLEILITIIDPVTYGEAWIANLLPSGNPMYDAQLTSWFFYTTTVSDTPPAALDMAVDYRPFSIDDQTGLMNFDGWFDSSQGIQKIGLFLRNNGLVMVPGVTGEISFPLSGIIPVDTTYTFGDMEPGAEVMGIFSADFSVTTPGKYPFLLDLSADGFTNGTASRLAFVGTYAELGYGQFSVTVPQGTITTQYLNFTYGPNLENLMAPTLMEWTVIPTAPFPGQLSPIPWEDPWWKVVGVGLIIGAGVNMIIDGVVEACNGDYLSPAAEKVNTGVAVVGGGAAALDVKDPFRRGEENTVPDPSELTIQETVAMNITYDVPPVAQEPFTGTVEWDFIRMTDGGSYSYSVVEPFMNAHYNTGRDVFINDTEFTEGDTLEITATLLNPDGLAYANIDAFMVAHISQKLTVQQTVPVSTLQMFDDGTNGDLAAGDGIYTAVLLIDATFAPGTYTWDVFSQDVNHALESDPPLEAATIIGGWMVGHPMPQPPEPPAMCGLVNDGEFDVI